MNKPTMLALMSTSAITSSLVGMNTQERAVYLSGLPWTFPAPGLPNSAMAQAANPPHWPTRDVADSLESLGLDRQNL